MYGKHKTLTTGAGKPVADNRNSLTAGPRGPVLMQDLHLMEKMARFNRERLPERVVHAKGYGAHGTFTVTGDITPYTRADLFAAVGRQTECFCRFSALGGEAGSADSQRDLRGFALKFYTGEGNWDLVGSNSPVFFVRDPLRFTDLIHAHKREPRSHLRAHWMRWDFWSRVPESLHQVMILHSERGIPHSARFMHGYGGHSYSLIDHQGRRHWVRFHLKTRQGIRNLPAREAGRMAGQDPDHAARDLFEAIERLDYPRWTLYIQMMAEKDTGHCRHYPFDATKVWPQEDYPLREVGVLELNRNPRNYFSEVEQAAFEPGNLVPGIGLSPDRLLQSRALAYQDAHRYRLGVNYDQIPINRARHAAVHTYHRDGLMRVDDNGAGEVCYEPNSFAGPQADPHYQEPPLDLDGPADRYPFPCDEFDYYEQPGMFYRRALDEQGRSRLVENIIASIRDVPREIQVRQLYHFLKADFGFGCRVAEALGLDIRDALGDSP